MPADLFNCWIEYSRIRPFGHENRLLATIAALIRNVHRGDAEPVGIDAYLPMERSPEEVRQEQMEKALIEAMNKNHRK